MDQTLRAAIISAVLSGDMPGAVRTAHGVLETEGHYQGYMTLVRALLESGNAEQAVPYFAVLREALPNDADVAYDYGLALQGCRRPEEAILQWKAAFDLTPGLAEACRDGPMALIDGGRAGETAGLSRLLPNLRSKDTAVLLRLGNIAFRNGRRDAARAYYRRALDVDGGCLEAGINLGEAERQAGRAEEAERCFRKVISRSPGARQAHFNLGALLLEQGRWRQGFAEFQWRANLNQIPAPLAALPEWDGAALPGRRIALWNDQGQGDALLFLRYAPLLKAGGAHVAAVLPPSLTRLAATAPGVDGVFTVDQALPSFDCQAPLASLPHLLGCPDPGATWTGPYLSAGAARPRSIGRRSIGLAWAAGSGSPNGRARSLPLEALAPLGRLPDIDWHSLQLAASAEIEASSWRGILRDLPPEISDFAATSEIIADLDLVISVDTAIAHLAGAMGKPVWILLARPCDWKWQTDGSTSVWYPTATLYRQMQGHGWGAVVAAVAEALRD